MARANPKPVPARRGAAGASGEIRIIGGQWRRTRLQVLQRPDLRPTPDRVRETLFNWLGQDLGGWRCVDAFAGTGALGLEAASRGAAQVHLFERDPGLAAALQQLCTRLSATHVRLARGDGVSLLGSLPAASMDLVLLDPPFGAGLHAPALAAAVRALAPGGRIYLEDGTRWDAAALEPLGLSVYRHLKAGAVHAHLLVRQEATA